jgi:hypothetical protein
MHGTYVLFWLVCCMELRAGHLPFAQLVVSVSVCSFCLQMSSRSAWLGIVVGGFSVRAVLFLHTAASHVLPTCSACVAVHTPNNLKAHPVT